VAAADLMRLRRFMVWVIRVTEYGLGSQLLPWNFGCACFLSLARLHLL
jgi:hypothetical protein